MTTQASLRVLSGPDEWRSADALNRTIREWPMAQTMVFSPEAFDATALEDALLNYSLFGDQSLVVIDRADALPKGTRDGLAALLAKRTESTNVLVRFTPNAKTVPTFDRGARLESFPLLTERTASDFIAERANALGITLDADATSALSSRVGPASSGAMVSELKKYALLGRAAVTAEDVTTMTPLHRDGNRWAWHDGVLGRDAKVATDQMGLLRTDTTNTPVGELTMLAGAVSDLAVAAAYRAAKQPIPPAVRRGAASNLHKWTDDEITDFLDTLTSTDRRLKGQDGGTDDGWQAIQHAIVRHTTPRPSMSMAESTTRPPAQRPRALTYATASNPRRT